MRNGFLTLHCMAATVFALMLCAPPGIAESGLAENPYAMDPNRACGPYCLLFLNRYFGGQAKYEEVADVCPAGPAGTSLHHVRVAAQKLGLCAAGVEVPLSQILQTGVPAILHLESSDDLNHFVVLLGEDSETGDLYLFSPPRTVAWRSREVIESRFTGIGLLVSDDPIPERLTLSARSTLATWYWSGTLVVLCGVLTRMLFSGVKAGKQTKHVCVLLALLLPGFVGYVQKGHGGQGVVDERRSVDLGELAPGDDLHHVFAIRNVTDREVTITGIEKTCSCQDIDISVGQMIAPGAVHHKGPHVVEPLIPSAVRSRVGEVHEICHKFKEAIFHFRIASTVDREDGASGNPH